MKFQLGCTYRLTNGEWVIYFGRSWPAWWKSDWAFLDPEKGTEVGSVNTRKMIKRYNPSRKGL